MIVEEKSQFHIFPARCGVMATVGRWTAQSPLLRVLRHAELSLLKGLYDKLNVKVVRSEG